ncbi:uncharacterized protein YxeA [Bacilli bacterium PM5-9]|nr:uncharacterized protein YxeA [Bacilli bacterium PM5-9]
MKKNLKIVTVLCFVVFIATNLNAKAKDITEVNSLISELKSWIGYNKVDKKDKELLQ